MRNFWKQIDKVLLGGVTVLFILLLSFLWYLVPPDYTLPMWVVSIILLVCYVICLVIYATCAGHKQEIVYRLPRVKAIHRTTNKVTFIVEKNDLFSQSALVTISYQTQENELESVLGIGVVETINSQGNLQVVFFSQPPEDKIELINKLSNSKADCDAIKIKPSISKEYYQGE